MSLDIRLMFVNCPCTFRRTFHLRDETGLCRNRPFQIVHKINVYGHFIIGSHNKNVLITTDILYNETALV